MRPTPILKGKAAKRFYSLINNKGMSDAQKKFIEECMKILHECE